MGHRLASGVSQRFRVLELSFVGQRASDGLSLHEAEIVLLRCVLGAVSSGRGCSRASVLDDEVRGQLVTSHASHRGHLLSFGSRLARVLMHDVGKIDPLVSVTIPILSRVWGCPWDLADASHLGVVGAHEHRRFTMACA